MHRHQGHAKETSEQRHTQVANTHDDVGKHETYDGVSIARLCTIPIPPTNGDMQGITSLSIDYSYRMTLVVEIVGTQDNCDEICIWEVSNHYGD